MKPIKFILLLLCATFLAGCASTGKYYPSDLTVEQLELRMQQAMDPSQILYHASTFVQQQIVTEKNIFGNTDYEIHLKYKAPDKLLLMTLYNNQPFSSMIFNSGAAWLTDYRKKEVKQLTGETLRKVQMLCKLSMPRSSYRELFKTVDISICRIDDYEYYLLKCESDLPGVYPLYVYVTKNTYLPRIVKGRFEIDGNDFVLNCDYESVVEEYEIFHSVSSKFPDAKLVLPKVLKRTQDNRTGDCRLTMFKVDVKVENAEFLPEFFAGRTYSDDDF